MPVLSAYRQVLSRPGAAAFSATGFVARLPISMVTLGIVLMVSAETDSYGLAGGISAAFVIASCLAALIQGRLIDRLGQARVLLPASAMCTVSLSLLVWAVEAGHRTPLPHVFAALAGATMPAIGAAVRARWTNALDVQAERETAFALEAVVDETVYLIGPPLATALATTLFPSAGLVAAIVAGLAGTIAFTSLRSTEPPVHPTRTGTGAKVAMPWGQLLPLALISLAMGGIFGSTEVVTVAFADSLGEKSVAGLLLALWALGSLVAGVITGAVTWRRTPAARMRIGIVAFTVLMAPTPLVDSAVAMGVLLFLAGFAIAPTLIAAVSFIEQTVPPSRLTEGIAMLTTTIAAGIAPGAAVAGVVVDAHGPHAAYLVPICSGLIGVLAAVGTHATRSIGSPREHLDELVTSGDGPADT
ncbi:MAG TPA: MFS transporter [Nocardioides sp.]|uniref:MFS transporter n=1 Tax=Nocardioides sp. TaxID=35761 RepID=UPI002E30558B|nr:MFS transporter [Nocardioides sp.]HEX5090984.1 MFS transporter [Nocardioides sp.]